LANVFRVKNNI